MLFISVAHTRDWSQYYPCVFIEGVRKATARCSQDGWSLFRSLEYNLGVLLLQQPIWLSFFWVWVNQYNYPSASFHVSELCHHNVIFNALITITDVCLVFYTLGENHCNVMGLEPLINFFKLHYLWLWNHAEYPVVKNSCQVLKYEVALLFLQHWHWHWCYR
jgi:hypothetical protein